MAVKVIGTGSALPEKIVTNDDLAMIMDTSDEWIKERTGISKRRLSTGETVADLATAACEKALEKAGKTADIGVVVVYYVSGACYSSTEDCSRES